MKNEESNFSKSLNLLDSTSIVIGSMIGSGIFIVSADMSRTLGSPGWLIIAWLVSCLMTIIAAVSYGELAGMMPKAGGQYVYLREAYNPLTGFLYGWTMFLVIQTGTIAAVGMAFAKFMGVIFPWFSQDNAINIFGNFKISNVQGLAILSILLLTWTNSRGIKLGKLVQNSFTFTKVTALIGFIIVGLFIASNTKAIQINKEIFWDAAIMKDGEWVTLTGFALLAALGTSMVGSLFSADAWNNITFTGAEIKNPKKNLPLSLFLGTVIVSLFYLVTNFVYLRVMPLRGIEDGASVFERGMQFATHDRLGTAAMDGLLGTYAALIMAIFIVISTFGCNNGLILAGARIYYAMAKDKLFFRQTAELNSHKVPANGLFIQGIWASILCLSGSYSQLLDYVVFAVLIFYVLTITGIYILRIKKPDAERPIKAFGYPYLPMIYIILAIIIMIILLIYKPNYTWPGLIIVLLGVPVYFLWKRKKVSI